MLVMVCALTLALATLTAPASTLVPLALRGMLVVCVLALSQTLPASATAPPSTGGMLASARAPASTRGTTSVSCVLAGGVAEVAEAVSIRKSTAHTPSVPRILAGAVGEAVSVRESASAQTLCARALANAHRFCHTS